MNFYKLAKTFLRLKSPRLKLMSLVGANLFRVRSVGVFLDPVMACNIRCKMCYFSDEKHRPAPLKPMSEEYVLRLKRSVFPRAVKLQIGCGAEPTLYKELPMLISHAKEAGVPYIEMTSNGQLLDYDSLNRYAKAGLNGLTLSLHGTSKEIYENLMVNARFERLLSLIEDLKRLKTDFPDFKLRVNYTFNNYNVGDLAGLWTLFGALRIDVLQIRPIQKIGESVYDDFDLERIVADYDTLIKPVEGECRRRGVLYIGPDREELSEVNDRRDAFDRVIEEMTYCYVSSEFCFKDDFDLERDTVGSYMSRTGANRRLLGMVFGRDGAGESSVVTTKKMNYKIK